MEMLEADYSTPSRSKKAKWLVAKATFKKWQRELENDYEMMSWLRCEIGKMPQHCVSKLFCSTCQRYSMETRYVG